MTNDMIALVANVALTLRSFQTREAVKDQVLFLHRRGLFRIFSDGDRERNVSSLASVTVPGSKLIVLCFSDLQPGDSGPRRVSKAEIRQSFKTGWRLASIHSATFESNLSGDLVKAWLSEIIRG